MVEIPDLVSNKIKNFIDLIENNGFKIQRAYLFGSYANGKADKWSDIDLALISDRFKGDRFLDLLSLTDYILKAGKDISPLPFRSEDFDASLFARDEILKKGISII
ncbi:MAG: nucleotidyltransferase domain-containing protein [bacterium]